MDELRREIREAFARQQAPLGPLAGVRERILAEAFDRRDPAGWRPWPVVGGAIALLLAGCWWGPCCSPAGARVRFRPRPRRRPGQPLPAPPRRPGARRCP